MLQGMEIPQSWRPRLSFKNATIVLSVVNVIAVLLLLQGFFSYSFNHNKLSHNNFNSVQLRYIRESEEIRLAMQPWDLIKRVREIEQEAYAEPETVQQNEIKQAAAVDLSKRLKDFRAINDAASLKALEEWRKRKMERARLREREKIGTSTT